jgi:hypothetical protein
MNKLVISFEHQNVRWENSRWIFARGHPMRFEWLALLAFRRLGAPKNQGWVEVDDIAKLPRWAGKNRRSLTMNIARYLQTLQIAAPTLVSADTRWAGPYRLNAGATSIEFDIPLADVKKRLRLYSSRPAVDRKELFGFTLSYARSQCLVFRGRLMPTKRRGDESAYAGFLKLAGQKGLSPRLRLIAQLGAVQILFRVGQFKLARKILIENDSLLRTIQDRALKAQYYLALAWSYQRATSGVAPNRAVEKAISNATAFAETSGDRATLGLIGHRTGGYFTKKGFHAEAVIHYLESLDAHLITGNYEIVQSTCGNIGSVIHRLGPQSYAEARRWLLLGIAIARWMNIGHDDAHGEMILAKIYIEQGKARKAYWLLKRAERIAEIAGNRVNLGDTQMVWGFWYQKFGNRTGERDTLLKALQTFGGIRKFDLRQKKRYMAKQFPEVWSSVLARQR